MALDRGEKAAASCTAQLIWTFNKFNSRLTLYLRLDVEPLTSASVGLFLVQRSPAVGLLILNVKRSMCISLEWTQRSKAKSDGVFLHLGQNAMTDFWH